MKMKAICIRNEDGNSMNHWFKPIDEYRQEQINKVLE